MELLRSNRILILWDDLDLSERRAGSPIPIWASFFSNGQGPAFQPGDHHLPEAPADVPILPRLARSWAGYAPPRRPSAVRPSDRATGERYRNGELSLMLLPTFTPNTREIPLGWSRSAVLWQRVCPSGAIPYPGSLRASALNRFLHCGGWRSMMWP